MYTCNNIVSSLSLVVRDTLKPGSSLNVFVNCRLINLSALARSLLHVWTSRPTCRRDCP